MPKKISRNPRTAFRTFDGVTLIITPDDRRVHRLNATGSFIWDRVGEKEMTRAELAHEMEREFDAPLPQIEKDLDRFISELSEKNVIVLKEGHE